jgi:hypothetical protein
LNRTPFHSFVHSLIRFSRVHAFVQEEEQLEEERIRFVIHAVRVHVVCPVLDTSPNLADFLIFFLSFRKRIFGRIIKQNTHLLNRFSFENSAGDNFSAPMRDDSETFKNSLAGQSNWNAYEGGDEKPLTPEEKKAKNAKEDAEAAARRAASAAKMAAERKAAGA